MPYAKTSELTERRALREKMRACGLSHRQIAVELARRYSMRPRAAWRHAYGWSLKQAAHRITDYAAQAGVGPDGSTVAMTGPHLCELEAWPGYAAKPSGRRPTPYLLTLLAAVYGCAIADLLDLADHEHMRPADLLILASTRPAVDRDQSGTPRHDDAGRPALIAVSPRGPAPLGVVAIPDAGARRAGTELDIPPAAPPALGDERPGQAGTGALPMALADSLAEAARWAEVSNVGDELLGYLDDAARQIARDYQRHDPGPVVSRAAILAVRATGLLAGHQRLSQRRDLYVVGAKLMAFLAWACDDLGQHASAAAHGRTAWVLARESGHRGAQALVCCARSKTAFWAGDHAQALRLACQGYETCPPGTLRVLLAAQQADAAPGPGDAMAAVTRARRALEEARSKDDLGGVFSCSASRLANYAIGAHLRNGDVTGALRQADVGLRAYQRGPGEAYGTWGQILIGASLAHVRAGDVGAAAGCLAPVLAMPPHRRLATLSGRLGEVSAALAVSRSARSRAAAELRERVTGYQRESFG
jgi:hypothetical protein